MKTRNAEILGLLLLLIAAFLAVPVRAGDTGPASEEKALSREEAAALVLRIFPKREATVLQVSEGPIRGLWEILLEMESGRTILYVDESRQYFLTGPIMAVEGMRNMTRESLLVAGPPRVDVSSIPLDDALVLGNPRGGRKVVVFLSPTCAACEDLYRAMRSVASFAGDVAFYLKMLAFRPNDDTYWKSETVVSERSLELLERSLAGKPIPRPKDPEPRVAETMALAERLGIRATPAIVLGDGTLVEGSLPPDALLDWIRRHS